MPPLDIITLLSQFGFPAVMAAVIFWVYQRQNDRLMKFISEYVTALQQMSATLERHNAEADARMSRREEREDGHHRKVDNDHQKIMRGLGALPRRES